MMKYILFKITILTLMLLMSSKSLGHDNSSILEGTYLGQKTPGLTPEIFAPGIVSAEHRDGSGFFSQDMKEFYFTRKDNISKKWSLVTFKNENNQWREFMVEPRVGRPILSPDGQVMYLGKKYKERTNTGWSEIKSLGSPYEDIRIMRLMSSNKGTYFFDEGTRNGKGVLRYSRLVNGKREKPQPLSEEINTGKWNAHPFIAPDESYIIWDGERDNGFGDNDLYISFRQQNGSWGSAINLGEKVNTNMEENGAYVTPDGKYLFFNRNGDLYWLDSKIIENIRTESQNENK